MQSELNGGLLGGELLLGSVVSRSKATDRSGQARLAPGPRKSSVLLGSKEDVEDVDEAKRPKDRW